MLNGLLVGAELLRTLGGPRDGATELADAEGLLVVSHCPAHFTRTCSYVHCLEVGTLLWGLGVTVVGGVFTVVGA